MLGANLSCGIVQTRGDTRDKLNFRKGKGGRRQRKRATEYESVHQSMKGNGSSYRICTFLSRWQKWMQDSSCKRNMISADLSSRLCSSSLLVENFWLNHSKLTAVLHPHNQIKLCFWGGKNAKKIKEATVTRFIFFAKIVQVKWGADFKLICLTA